MEKLVLQEAAVALGFKSDFVADVLEKLGPGVLEILVNAVRNGFSVNTVVDLFTKLGPLMLDVVTQFLSSLKSPPDEAVVGSAMAVPSKLVVGEEVPLLDGSVLAGLLEKLLPTLINKYGDQLVQVLVDLLMKSLSK